MLPIFERRPIESTLPHEEIVTKKDTENKAGFGILPCWGLDASNFPRLRLL